MIQMNIRGSMYRIVFALVALPFLLFSLLITRIYSNRLEQALTDSLGVVADAHVAEMTSFCEQQRDYLRIVGSTDMFHSAMRGTLDQGTLGYLDNVLYSRIENIDYMKTLTVIDTRRQVVACSTEHAITASDGFDLLVSRLGDRDFYISDILLDAQGEQTLVSISRVTEGDELLGYVLAELDMGLYKRIREQAALWPDATFYLLDGKRNIISAGTQKEGRDSFISTDREREDYLEKYNAIDLAAQPKGSFQYTVSGRQYITYYSDLEYTNWSFMLTVDLDSYQAQKTVYHVLAVCAVALCAIMAIWVGAFASRRIVRPIQRISGTLRAIQEKQDYALRIPVERQDELGSLAVEINGLIDFIETEDLYQAQQKRLLQEKADQDALTKVLNKERIGQHLQERVALRQADAGPLAVLFIDIDDFKSFNTNYGHIVGDQVLLFLSSLLSRETGGTVGRVGGDEFLTVVESPQVLQDLDRYLTRIGQAAAHQFLMRGSGAHLPISCSIGAVRVDFSASAARGLTPSRLIQLADAAMYQVKNNGKQGHAIVDYPQPED